MFNPITIGIEEQEFTEVAAGLKEGQQIISTGAAALRPGDKIAMAGQQRGGGGRRNGGAAGARGSQGAATNANRGQQRGQ